MGVYKVKWSFFECRKWVFIRSQNFQNHPQAVWNFRKNDFWMTSKIILFIDANLRTASQTEQIGIRCQVECRIIIIWLRTVSRSLSNWAVTSSQKKKTSRDIGMKTKLLLSAIWARYFIFNLKFTSTLSEGIRESFTILTDWGLSL